MNPSQILFYRGVMAFGFYFTLCNVYKTKVHFKKRIKNKGLVIYFFLFFLDRYCWNVGVQIIPLSESITLTM